MTPALDTTTHISRRRLENLVGTAKFSHLTVQPDQFGVLVGGSCPAGRRRRPPPVPPNRPVSPNARRSTHRSAGGTRSPPRPDATVGGPGTSSPPGRGSPGRTCGVQAWLDSPWEIRASTRARTPQSTDSRLTLVNRGSCRQGRVLDCLRPRRLLNVGTPCEP